MTLISPFPAEPAGGGLNLVLLPSQGRQGRGGRGRHADRWTPKSLRPKIGTECMALNRDFIGRSFPPSEPYEVSRVKIREFATAIGDSNPIYTDRPAAENAGHPDVIAPPTFPIAISLGVAALADPDLGLNYMMVVHGEQRFTYTRPIHAGDVLTTQSTITGIRSAGNNEVMTIETEIKTLDGELVCTTFNSIVERGA